MAGQQAHANGLAAVGPEWSEFTQGRNVDVGLMSD